MMSRRRVAAAVLPLFLLSFAAPAADWPTWRCDPNRSGSAAENLPDELHLQWTLRLGALQPAWPDEPRMRFDTAYQPVVIGETMFVGSSRNDSVTAYDLAGGSVKWRAYFDGPVRFAPACWNGRLYVAADDGCLYCLDATDGSILWTRRGGPTGRKLLGNERLTSAWPARGGPVVLPAPSSRAGKTEVYFAAGIWPFMGVFVYALDAETGKVIWCNDSSGSIYIKQPHDSPAFSGLAPQGYLAASGDVLVVPNGRAAAAGLDRNTGKLLYFHHAKNKRTGHSEAAIAGDHLINSAMVADLATGKGLFNYAPGTRGVGMRYAMSSMVFADEGSGEEVAAAGEIGVLAGTTCYLSGGVKILAQDTSKVVEITTVDSSGKRRKTKGMARLWEFRSTAKPMLRAGRRLYAGGPGDLLAIDLPRQARAGSGRAKPRPKLGWRKGIDGTPAAMIAANGRLIVVTLEGDIRCYGADPVAEAAEIGPAAPPAAAADEHDGLAGEILKATGVTEGYCLVLGLRDGGLAERLTRLSKLRVIVVDDDAAGVAAFRRRIDAAGVPFKRLSAVVGDPHATGLPPYLASLIVTEDVGKLGPAEDAPVAEVFRALRPYGGTVCLALAEEDRAGVVQMIADANLPGASVTQVGELTLVTRAGPLPGAGAWTGQYGDPSNTVVSPDSLVKAPLGLLWFGGPSNESILPRHGHGPPEQVIGGRLFIEGPDLLRALDVYTGRRLWETVLPGVGANFDYTSHVPSANALGTNYIAARDAVYVVHGRRCLRLDPATGRIVGQFVLPKPAAADEPPEWGYVGVWKDLLIAGSAPIAFWKPTFAVSEFKKSKRSKEISSDELDALREAVEAWQDFEPARPKNVFVPPSIRELDKPLKTKPADLLDFVVADLNKMLGEEDVLSKIPADVVAEAKKRERKPVAQWEEARWNDDYFARPKPPTVDDLAEAVGQFRASGQGGPPDGRGLALLNRRLLEHLYPKLPTASKPRLGTYTVDHTASGEIVVMNRQTGDLLWRRPAASAIGHNTICLGAGKLFCIDRMPQRVAARLLRRGRRPSAPDTLLALDIRTGKTVWSTTEGVFGTWLSYSAEHDLLLQAGRASRDMLADEPKRRMTAYRGETGKVIWDRHDSKFSYSGPCMLHGRTIVTQTKAFDLLTGKTKKRTHPLTGESIDWKYKRNYGCNTVVASRHLLTFRSAAAGFYDLLGDSGTGNIGGFKSSCTSNLVVADGVLNAPDYTRTCTYSYQNQSSLALVHMPDVEMWTFQEFSRGKGSIRRLGINFGAPGDRLADNGTLWLEYPYVGGPSPKVEIKISKPAAEGDDLEKLSGLHDDGKPDKPDKAAPAVKYFSRHSSGVGGDGPKWIAASGLEGPAEITISLRSSRAAGTRKHTVVLHFAEPGTAGRGQRVFDVALQGERVLDDFDVIAEAGAALAPVVRTFKSVAVKSKLTITLTPAAGASAEPILCGVEIVREE